jgi:hypothetical protein
MKSIGFKPFKTVISEMRDTMNSTSADKKSMMNDNVPEAVNVAAMKSIAISILVRGSAL